MAHSASCVRDHEDVTMQAMRKHHLNEKITDAVMQLLSDHTHHTNSMAEFTDIDAFVNYDHHLDSSFNLGPGAYVAEKALGLAMNHKKGAFKAAIFAAKVTVPGAAPLLMVAERGVKNPMLKNAGKYLADPKNREHMQKLVADGKSGNHEGVIHGLHHVWKHS
jgi:hypothetical protein